MLKDEEEVFKKVSQLGFSVKQTPQHFLQPLSLPSQQQHEHDRSPSGSPSYIITASVSPTRTRAAAGTNSSPALTTSRGLGPATKARPGQLLASSATAVSSSQGLRTTSPQAGLLPPLSPSRLANSSGSASPYLDVSGAINTINRSSTSSAQHQHVRTPGSPSHLSPLRPTKSSQYVTVQVAGDHSWPSADGAGPGSPAAGTPSSPNSSRCSARRAGTAAASDSSPEGQSRQQPRSRRSSAPSSPSNKQQALQRGPQDSLSPSSQDAVAAAARRRRRYWDSNTNPPVEPSFEAALRAWQGDVEEGVYGPRFLGSFDAVTTGNITAAATAAHSLPNTASTSRLSSTGPASAAAAATPSVFQGTGEEAMQALEGLVLQKLVAKPHLTLMQLQRGIQAVSVLESQYQLAAIGVMIQGGCWMSAMQVAYADLSVLAEVLLEMRTILETGLQWDNQLAAMTWHWNSLDRDLFMRSFRGLGLVSQYQQLRKQLTRLQCSSNSIKQAPTQPAAPGSPTAAAQAAVAGGDSAEPGVSSNGRVSSCHPELAKAERLLLLSVIDNYLADVDAALAAQAAAAAEDAQTQQQGFSVLAVTDQTLESVSSQSDGHADGTDTGVILAGDSQEAAVPATLLVSSDWRVFASSQKLAAAQQQQQDEQEQQQRQDNTALEASVSSQMPGNIENSLVLSSPSSSQRLSAPAASAPSSASTKVTPATSKRASSTNSRKAQRQQSPKPAKQAPSTPAPAVTDSFSVKSVPADAVVHTARSSSKLGGSSSSSSNKRSSSAAAAVAPEATKANRQQARRHSAAAGGAVTVGPAKSARAPKGASPFETSISADKLLSLQQPSSGNQHMLGSVPEEEQQQQQEKGLQEERVEIAAQQPQQELSDAMPGGQQEHPQHSPAIGQHVQLKEQEQQQQPLSASKDISPQQQDVQQAEPRANSSSTAEADTMQEEPQNEPIAAVGSPLNARQSVGSAESDESLQRTTTEAAGAVPTTVSAEPQQNDMASSMPAKAADDSKQQLPMEPEHSPQADTADQPAGPGSRQDAALEQPQQPAAEEQSAQQQQEPQQDSLKRLEQRPSEAVQSDRLAQPGSLQQAQAAQPPQQQQQQQPKVPQSQQLEAVKQNQRHGRQPVAVASAKQASPRRPQPIQVPAHLQPKPQKPEQGSKAVTAAAIAEASPREARTTEEIYDIAEDATEDTFSALSGITNLTKDLNSLSADLLAGRPVKQDKLRKQHNESSAEPEHMQHSSQQQTLVESATAQQTAADSNSTDLPAEAAVAASSQQQQPQAPSEHCSRPQSRQTSRRPSMMGSRPGSAQVQLYSSMIDGRDPGIIAAALQAANLGSSWSRPGSSSRPIRPQSATHGQFSSRPGSAAAAVRNASSRPRSADSTDATEAGLQRLRDTCAEQRKNMELIAQSVVSAEADAAAAADHQANAAVEALGSPRAAGSPRPWSASKSGFSSRPQSAQKRSSIDGPAAAVAGADALLPGLEVSGQQSSTAEPFPEGPEQGLEQGLGHLGNYQSYQLGAAGQLERVPEEPSQLQLNWEHSQLQETRSKQSAGAEVAAADDQQTGASAADLAQQQSRADAAEKSELPSQSAQKQLPEEVQRTMHLFQQRLQQTALMAQQLLAQQVAGQAARRSSRGTSSRPGSAGGPPGSNHSRPSSASQRVAGVPGALGGRGLGALEQPWFSSDGGSGLGFGMTPRKLAALGGEEAPTTDEVVEYARYLGMDPEQDADLLYIAEWALTAPCPDAWTIHLDKEGNEFFYNTATEESTYEHPMDRYYRDMYQQKKREKLQE